MDELRLILLLGGVVLIGLVYWRERRSHTERRRQAERESGLLFEESWSILPEEHDVDLSTLKTMRPDDRQPITDVVPSQEAAVPEPPPEELLVALSIVAVGEARFSGGAVRRALEEAGFVYGEMKIWHAPADLEHPEGAKIYSIANLVEPGTLEPAQLETLKTPGLFLFMRLPGPLQGPLAFQLMRASGEFIARELGGELRDERLASLTDEQISAIEERIHAEIGERTAEPDPL